MPETETAALVKCANCDNMIKPPREICKACEIIKDNEASRLAAEAKKKEDKQAARAAQEIARASHTAKMALERAKEKLEEAAEEREEKEAEQFNSSVACKPDEIRDILRDRRNLTQSYIVEAAYRTGVIAAKRLRIIPNRYFWANGVLSALESLRADSSIHLLPIVENVKCDGDVFRNQDRLALWDFGCSWREQPEKQDWWEEGHRITYPEYEKLRALKGDPCQLGNVLLNKDFEDLHKKWQEFYPPININALPENYTQRQFKAALRDLAPIHKYCQMAFRGSFKTAFMAEAYLVAFVATFPDVRILFASATTPLSTDTSKKFKAHFVLEGEEPTLFQQIFSELVLYTRSDEGSVVTYESPAARLKLAQPTAFAVALGSTVAGRRCDILVSDDLSDNTNSDTPELRAGTQRRFELLTQLIEGGGAGFIFLIGTPYALGDLLWTAIDRNDRNTEKSLAVRIDPCLDIIDETRRREVLSKPELLYELQEHEVKMKLPSQYGWAAWRQELMNSEIKQVLQQKLLLFTEDGAGNIRLNFEEEVLYLNVVDTEPQYDADSQAILSVDRAHSIKLLADRSSLSVVKFYTNILQQPSMIVTHNRADRWRTSELATNIVDTAIQDKVNLVVIEQDPSWRDLDDAIKLVAGEKGYEIPLFWKPVSQTPRAKIIKFKQLEALLNRDPAKSRLTFLRGPWIADCFAEFLWQDGIRVSSGKQKDDRIDSIGQAALFLKTPQSTPDALQAQAAREKALEREMMLRQRDWIHGGASAWKAAQMAPPPPPEPIENPNQDSPIHRLLAKYGLTKQSANQLSYKNAPIYKPRH